MNNTTKYSIVHIATSINGGAGRAAYRLHQALLQDGLNSAFLTLDSNFPGDAVNCFTFKHKHPHFFKRIYNRLKRIWINVFKVVPEIEHYRLIDQWENISSQLHCELATLPFTNLDTLSHPVVRNADIIHLHWVSGILDYPDFFKRVKKSLVWTLHDMYPFQGVFHYKEDEQNNYEIAGLFDTKIKEVKKRSYESFRMALKIVTPSSWMEEEARNSGVFKPFPIVTIPYSLNLETFSPRRIEEARKNLGLPPKAFLLLFVSSYIQNRRKGFDLLVDALQKVPHLPVTIVAMGNIELEKCKSLPIHFVGVIKDESILAEYYSAANALILPSREDNLPNVMLESLACGTPIIGFPIGGIKEHVLPFRTGILTSHVSSEALASAIESMYHNYGRMDRAFIRNYAVDHFNNKLQASSYKDVYKDLYDTTANGNV